MCTYTHTHTYLHTRRLALSHGPTLPPFLLLCLPLILCAFISLSCFSSLAQSLFFLFCKRQVSFAKEPYKRDDILQKRPMILRSLLIVATPYHLYVLHFVCVSLFLFLCPSLTLSLSLTYSLSRTSSLFLISSLCLIPSLSP